MCVCEFYTEWHQSLINKAYSILMIKRIYAYLYTLIYMHRHIYKYIYDSNIIFSEYSYLSRRFIY